MLRSGVRLPKEQLRVQVNASFIQMACFSQIESSLYQCLSVGLIEIMLRFTLAPDHVKVITGAFNHLVQPTGQVASPATTFARGFRVEPHLDCFLSLIANVRDGGAPDLKTRFSWLKYYAETENAEANTALDVGMRVLLGAILVGKIDVHNDMMNCRQVEESILLGNFATKMGVEIDVYEGGSKTEYMKSTAGTYPLISLIKGVHGYGLLYTSESVRIEEGSGFTKEDLERFPFACVRVVGGWIKQTAPMVPVNLGGSFSNAPLRHGGAQLGPGGDTRTSQPGLNPSVGFPAPTSGTIPAVFNPNISTVSNLPNTSGTQMPVHKNLNGGIPSTNQSLGFPNWAPNGLPTSSNNRPGGTMTPALPNQNVPLLPRPSQAFGAHSSLPVPSSTRGPNLTSHPPAPLNHTGLPPTTNFNQGGNLPGPGGISQFKPALQINNFTQGLQGANPNTVGKFPGTIAPPGFSKTENLPIPGNLLPSMPTSSVNIPPGQNLK